MLMSFKDMGHENWFPHQDLLVPYASDFLDTTSETDLGAEPKVTTQRLILRESTVQETSHETWPNQGPLSENGEGDPQRRQQGTVRVNYSCDPNRDKLMLHLSPRPVAQANLGSTGMHRGYTTAAESFLSFPLPSHIQPPSPQDMTLPWTWKSLISFWPSLSHPAPASEAPAHLTSWTLWNFPGTSHLCVFTYAVPFPWDHPPQFTTRRTPAQPPRSTEMSPSPWRPLQHPKETVLLLSSNGDAYIFLYNI